MSMFRNEYQIRDSPVQREKERMKNEMELTDRIEELTSMNRIMQKADFECSSQAVSARVQRHKQLILQREAELGRRALIMARRAALQDLLEKDRQQYTVELKQTGEAFYPQRK